MTTPRRWPRKCQRRQRRRHPHRQRAAAASGAGEASTIAGQGEWEEHRGAEGVEASEAAEAAEAAEDRGASPSRCRFIESFRGCEKMKGSEWICEHNCT